MLKQILLLVFMTSFSAYAENSDDMIMIGEKQKPVTVTLNDGRTGLRYILRQDANGNIQASTLQEQIIFDITIHFFKDRVRLNLEGGTGGNFTAGWMNSGLGPEPPDFSMNLRRLAITLGVTSGLEISVGSIAPVQGTGSENTYIDNDGYIMGYRAQAKVIGGELIVTGGFVGDYQTPNVFQRFNRMNDFNFAQAIYTHAIGDVIQASIEYDHFDSNEYARAALKIDLAKWTQILDSAIFEDIRSIDNTDVQNSFAVKLSKRFKDAIGARDIQIDASFIDKMSNLKIPTGDKIFNGNQVRVTLTLPDLLTFKKSRLALFADYVQSLEDIDIIRAELGLNYRF